MSDALEKYFADRGMHALQYGIPAQWIVCPSCGAQSWVFPPHGLAEPCPLIVEGMEQLGMKFDAERNAAIRTGVGIEEIARAAREMSGEDG